MTTTDTADTPVTTDATPDPIGPPPRRSALARLGPGIGLLVLAAALVVTGVLLLVRAHDLDSDGALANRAVIDRSETSAVIGQVSTALNQVLSYDYAKPQLARKAAATWLTGDAPEQYKVLFTQLQTLAPGQKLTIAAKVTTAGVTSLRGDTAQLLVFVDQQSTRASDNQSSVSAAQVQITAVRQDGRWRISELKPL